MHQQSTIGVRAGQSLPSANPFNRSNPRTDASFPPPALDWALQPDQWQAVRKLLDSDLNLTLRDIFTEAVAAYLDDLADESGNPVTVNGNPPAIAADAGAVQSIDLPLTLLVQLGVVTGLSVVSAQELVENSVREFVGILTRSALTDNPQRPGRLYDLPGVIRCRVEGGVS